MSLNSISDFDFVSRKTLTVVMPKEPKEEEGEVGTVELTQACY